MNGAPVAAQVLPELFEMVSQTYRTLDGVLVRGTSSPNAGWLSMHSPYSRSEIEELLWIAESEGWVRKVHFAAYDGPQHWELVSR